MIINRNSASHNGGHVDGEARARLLDAALEGVANVGWANLTIAEIVRCARVSKRTFYEHFTTKDACLLALFESVSTTILDELERASSLVPLKEGRVEAGAEFYLTHLQEQPRVARTLVLEILSLGSEGLATRRRVMRRFAAFLQREINAAGTQPPISIDVAMLIVGGINELTLEALEEERIDQLTDLVAPISRLIRGVLGGE